MHSHTRRIRRARLRNSIRKELSRRPLSMRHDYEIDELPTIHSRLYMLRVFKKKVQGLQDSKILIR